MGRPINNFYEFDVFRADPLKRALLKNGSPVPLTPKAFDILIALIERRGQVVDKDELINVVWDGAIIEEHNLARNISYLRRALGETPNTPRYIVTVPGRGYSFVEDVESLPYKSKIARSGQQSPPLDAAETRSNGSNLAPQIDGYEVGIQTHESESQVVTRSYVPASIERLVNQKVVVIASVIAFFVAAGAIFLSGKFSDMPATSSLEINRLTYSGDAHWAAISPDGEYVTYMSVEGGKQSLRIMQIATLSNQELIPPSEVPFHTGIFSPDGRYVYYTKGDPTWQWLYRIPTVGGVSQKLIEGLRHLGNFSPDGSQITFVRTQNGEHELIVASADGSWERQIAVRSSSELMRRPAWSPNGRVIACAVGIGHGGGIDTKLFEFRVEDGSAREVSKKGWKYTGWSAWLADGSGIVMTGEDESTSGEQIWHISYPDGRTRRITNDSTAYRTLSMASGVDRLLATKMETDFNLWVVPYHNPAHSKRIADGVGFISGMPDGRIAYSSGTGTMMDVWIVNADGTGRRQLTNNIGVDSFPVVSPDGRHIFFTSDRTGSFEIWKMDADGNNQIQLTVGGGNRIPSCSTDGNWLVYEHVEKTRITLRKVSINGGEPVQLTDWATTSPSVSPDSRYLASWKGDRIVITSIEDGRLVKTLENVRPREWCGRIRWADDDKALIHESYEGGASNLWSQPLDGSPSKKLTDFKEGKIYDFDWSGRSGQLAIVRGDWKHDVVLIKNFR